MKQIGNSNEDMLALLEAVVGIKNELQYIRVSARATPSFLV